MQFKIQSLVLGMLFSFVLSFDAFAVVLVVVRDHDGEEIVVKGADGVDKRVVLKIEDVIGDVDQGQQGGIRIEEGTTSVDGDTGVFTSLNRPIAFVPEDHPFVAHLHSYRGVAFQYSYGEGQKNLNHANQNMAEAMLPVLGGKKDDGEKNTFANSEIMRAFRSREGITDLLERMGTLESLLTFGANGEVLPLVQSEQQGGQMNAIGPSSFLHLMMSYSKVMLWHRLNRSSVIYTRGRSASPLWYGSASSNQEGSMKIKAVFEPAVMESIQGVVSNSAGEIAVAIDNDPGSQYPYRILRGHINFQDETFQVVADIQIEEDNLVNMAFDGHFLHLLTKSGGPPVESSLLNHLSLGEDALPVQYVFHSIEPDGMHFSLDLGKFEKGSFKELAGRALFRHDVPALGIIGAASKAQGAILPMDILLQIHQFNVGVNAFNSGEGPNRYFQGSHFCQVLETIGRHIEQPKKVD